MAAKHPERLPRRQHAELVASGVRHDHPTDFALADVEASRPKGKQTIDFLLLIAVGGRSKVEM